MRIIKGGKLNDQQIQCVLEDINDTCTIAKIPAEYRFSEKLNSFECISELVSDKMLLPKTKGLSEEQFYEWTEKCNVLVMDKWSDIHMKNI